MAVPKSGNLWKRYVVHQFASIWWKIMIMYAPTSTDSRFDRHICVKNMLFNIVRNTNLYYIVHSPIGDQSFTWFTFVNDTLWGTTSHWSWWGEGHRGSLSKKKILAEHDRESVHNQLISLERFPQCTTHRITPDVPRWSRTQVITPPYKSWLRCFLLMML